ncbi:MAG TPA: sugar ABC transporter permease [Spirochaetales bacterium]|nr:sugar ABC transporter permease [Spirochaetales bacterium]HPG85504.1 sugar ABC transporter permease [Spirochaetales bacterium]HPM72230.1 sugar ABC transporter permease [Spirochaetales bacterium]
MPNRNRLHGEEGRAYWSMVLPAFSIYLLVMAFPIVLSIVLSVSNYSGGKMFGGEPWGFAGLKSYARVFSDPLFWNALKNNFYIVLLSVFGQLPLGFIFAYIIYRRLVKWPGFWQGVLYVPNIISVIVVGLLWQTIFSPNGPIAEVMNDLARAGFQSRLEALFASVGGFNVDDGLVSKILDMAGPAALDWFSDPVPELKELILSYEGAPLSELIGDLCNLFVPRWSPEFLSKPNIAMLPVLFVILWMYTGMYLILFLANMQKIDSQVIEAARIDGASEGQVMRYVILPALSGTIVNSAILAISGSLSSFSLIFAMTGGGPSRVTEILSIYMYNNAFLGRPNLPLANAISLVMVVISFILIGLTKMAEKRYGGKEE